MVSMAGLSAVYPAYQRSQGTSAQNRLRDATAGRAETYLAGQAAFGNTLKLFQQAIPGAQPMQNAQPTQPAPQPPMPGQPSVSSGPPRQGPAFVPPGAGPSSQAQPRPPQRLGRQGIMDWRQVAQAVVRANPGAKPEVIAAAVGRFMPLMNAASQAQWRQVQSELQKSRLAETREYHRQLLKQRGARTSLNPNRVALEAFMRDNPDASPDEISGFLRNLRASASVMDKRAKAAATVASVKSQIDDAIGQLEESKRGGPKVAGVVGTGRRLYESIGGLLGTTDETAASDFETKIRLIQSALPRVIAGTSRIAAAERARLDQIVRGLDEFTSADQALSSLKYVRKILGRSVPGASQQQSNFKGGVKPLTDDVKKNALRAMKMRGWSREDVVNTLREHGYDTRGF